MSDATVNKANKKLDFCELMVAMDFERLPVHSSVKNLIMRVKP